MNILVLIKQVPATETPVETLGAGPGQGAGIRWIMNPYDEIAVEEALRIKEAVSGSVTALSFGRDETCDALIKAMAMGVDEAVLIQDDLPGRCRDGMTTTAVLTRAIRRYPFDLVIAGHRAIDDDGYCTGPAVAGMLDIPCISRVIQQRILADAIRCQRIIKGGTQWVEVPRPMLFTAYRGLNTPRYATFPSLKRARKKPVQRLFIEDLGFDRNGFKKSPVQPISMEPLPNSRSGQMMEARTPEQKVGLLVEKLLTQARVI